MLMGLMVVSAVAELVSLGAVLPFLSVLVAPERLFDRPFIADLAGRWGIASADQLVLPLTILFATAAVCAGVIRMLLLWLNTRVAFASGADLSIEVYRRTLYQPYRVHVARNSSEVISGITIKVAGTVNVLYQLIVLVSSVGLLVILTLALLAVDAGVALTAIAAFGSGYGLVTWISGRRLHQNSKRIAFEQTQVIKALQEGLGGIRDVLLDGTQPVYCEIYRRSDHPLRIAQGDNAFITQSPRYAMEALGMVLIAALAYSLSNKPGGVATALPVLGALALGAQRLLPALQQSYGAWADIISRHASLADTVDLLDQPLPVELSLSDPEPLPFRHAICFDAVRFRYAPGGAWVLDGIELVIAKGARVGFVGVTGSGKSTAMDLLMGLLTATEGQLLVDGQAVGSGRRLRAWQRTIAHVPQNIYLADTSVAENIAFGVPTELIDMERVRMAARQAQIADFIEKLPKGYDAFVGERGIRLSGGQRQRIGIARALYKQASILVFDEATSALDNATEEAVMDAIGRFKRDLTILLIAHRLTTVRHCDTIVEFSEGKVVAQGTYDELLATSPSFRNMARAVVV